MTRTQGSIKWAETRSTQVCEHRHFKLRKSDFTHRYILECVTRKLSHNASASCSRLAACRFYSMKQEEKADLFPFRVRLLKTTMVTSLTTVIYLFFSSLCVVGTAVSSPPQTPCLFTTVSMGTLPNLYCPLKTESLLLSRYWDFSLWYNTLKNVLFDTVEVKLILHSGHYILAFAKREILWGMCTVC